jgi:MFS transporter, ACS family, glucarate transporter
MKNHVRYFIVFMLFFVSSINYADRATLSMAKGGLCADLQLSTGSFGWLMSAWGWSYVIAQLPAGWLLDRFGSKRVYGAAFFLWSLFIFLMGFTGALKGRVAFAVLFLLLFLAGFSFAPAFPGNVRFVAAWFPTKERGTASSIFNASQYFSLVLFAPLMGWIMGKLGWHYTSVGQASRLSLIYFPNINPKWRQAGCLSYDFKLSPVATGSRPHPCGNNC